tara:strand:+ start:178 stop:1095 length:918 start_codon:yes stop_codon:yes gene_type:complete
MNDSQEAKSNPEIGMSQDSFDETPENPGSDDFFTSLEQEVNGGIEDPQISENTEATQSQFSGPEQVTHSQDDGSNNVAQQSNDGTDWQKRYADSSREAVRWRDRYREVEKFVPVLDAMKKDSGLVDHVRSYLENGGAPAKSVQEELNLDEDFLFDQHEAMTDPESDSAKVMNSHVDKLVQQRVGQMVQAEKQRAAQIQRAQQMKQTEADFIKRHNMTPQEFAAFKEEASKHTMTLDDVHYLLNKGKVQQNVAANTKQDMMKQMKNVRNMPTSASGVNSQGKAKTEDRSVFESILGFDSGTDNLFG